MASSEDLDEFGWPKDPSRKLGRPISDGAERFFDVHLESANRPTRLNKTEWRILCDYTLNLSLGLPLPDVKTLPLLVRKVIEDNNNTVYRTYCPKWLKD